MPIENNIEKQLWLCLYTYYTKNIQNMQLLLPSNVIKYAAIFLHIIIQLLFRVQNIFEICMPICNLLKYSKILLKYL